MEIVKPTGDSTVKIIPRESKNLIAVIYSNVSTDEVLVSDNKTPVNTDNSMSFDFTESEKTTLNVKEGQFINFEIVGAASIETETFQLYRGRMFVTDQLIDQIEDKVYDINKGVYKENQSDNEFIIY
jgi:hypothetical protein